MANYPTSKSANTIKWEKRRAEIDRQRELRKKKAAAADAEWRVKKPSKKSSSSKPQDSYKPASSGQDKDVARMSKLGRSGMPSSQATGTRKVRRRNGKKYLVETRKVKRRRVPQTRPDSEKLEALVGAGRDRAQRLEAKEQSNIPVPMVLRGEKGKFCGSSSVSATLAVDSAVQNFKNGNYAAGLTDATIAGGTIANSVYSSTLSPTDVTGAATSKAIGNGVTGLGVMKDLALSVEAFSKGHTCDGADALGSAVIGAVGLGPTPHFQALSAGGAVVNQMAKKPLQNALQQGARYETERMDREFAFSADRLRGQSSDMIRYMHKKHPKVAGQAITHLKEQIRLHHDEPKFCKEAYAEIQMIRDSLAGLH